MPAPATAMRGGFDDDSDSEVDEAAIRAEAVRVAENRALGKIPYPSGKSPLDAGTASSDDEFLSIASSPPKNNQRDLSSSVIDAAFRRASIGRMASTSTKGTDSLKKSDSKRKPFGEQHPNQPESDRNKALEDGWSVKSTDRKQGGGFSAQPLGSSRSRTSSMKSKKFAPNAALSDIPSNRPPGSRRATLTSTGGSVNGAIKKIPSTITNQNVQPIPKPFTYQAVRQQIAAASNAAAKPDPPPKARTRSVSQPKKKRSPSATQKAKPSPAPTTPRGHNTSATSAPLKSPGRLIYEQELRDRKEAENRIVRHKDFKKKLNEQERKKAREFTQAIREKEAKEEEELVLEYAWKPPYGGRAASPPAVSPQAPRVVSKSPQRNHSKHPHARDTFACLDPRQHDSEAYLIWLARKDEEAKRAAQQRILESKRKGIYEQVVRDKRDHRLNELIATQTTHIESSRKEREQIEKRAAEMLSPRTRDYYSSTLDSFHSDTSPHRRSPPQVLSIKNTLSPLHIDPLTPQVLPSIQQYLSPVSMNDDTTDPYNVDAYFPTNSSKKSASPRSPVRSTRSPSHSPPGSVKSWRRQQGDDFRSVSQVESLQAKTETLQQQIIDQQVRHQAQLAEQQQQMEERMRLFEQQLLEKHRQEQFERDRKEEERRFLDVESQQQELESERSKRRELERQQQIYEEQLKEDRERQKKEHEQRLIEENEMLQKQWEQQQIILQQQQQEEEHEREQKAAEEEQRERERQREIEFRRQMDAEAEQRRLVEEAEKEKERQRQREAEFQQQQQQQQAALKQQQQEFELQQRYEHEELLRSQHQPPPPRDDDLLDSLRDRRRSGPPRRHPEFKLRLLFMNADINGDGFVSPEEAFTALAEEGWPEPNDEDANNALAMVDPGRRGALSFYDFQKMVDVMYTQPIRHQTAAVNRSRHDHDHPKLSPPRSRRSSYQMDTSSIIHYH